MARRPWETAVAALLFSLAVPAWGEQYYLYSPKPAGPEEQSQGKDGILVREVPVEKGDTLSGISRRFSGHGSYYPQILLFNDLKDPNLIYAGSTLRVPVGTGQVSEASEARPAPSARKKAHRRHARKKASRAVQAAPSAVLPSKHKQQPAAGKAPSGDQTLELSPGDLKRLDNGHVKKAAVRKKGASEPRKRTGEGRQRVKQPVGEERVTGSVPGASSAAPTGEDSGQKLFSQAVTAYRQDDFRAALELFDRFLAQNPGSPLAADASPYKAECYLKLSNQ